MRSLLRYNPFQQTLPLVGPMTRYATKRVQGQIGMRMMAVANHRHIRRYLAVINDSSNPGLA